MILMKNATRTKYVAALFVYSEWNGSQIDLNEET